MNYAVDAMNEGRRRFQETVEGLQKMAVKLNSFISSVHKQPLLCFLLGVFALVVLLQLLVISALLMAPLFLVLCSMMPFLAGIFVVFLSFLSGFLVNFLLFAVTVTTSCYILYRIVRDVIRRVQKLTTDLLSWPACARQRLNVRLRELSSHLPKGISKGLPGDFGQRLPRKGKETRVSYKSYKESESSELEDIEPDYRDRETKLYDALVRRQNIPGSDTFDPFRYSVGPS